MTIDTSETRTAAERTARPGLFDGTCWGPCTDSDLVSDKIIRNRDGFAEHWRLKRLTRPQLPMSRRSSRRYECDHLEVYTTRDGGYVALCSNYGAPPPPALGMIEVRPVYSVGVRSFAAGYATLKVLRGAFRAAAEELLADEVQA
jgi:hypothetical protein